MAIKRVPSEFASINDALEIANPCDTILVAGGRFKNFGNTVIPSNLDGIRIIGTGMDNTIIDGSINCDSIGILISQSSYVTIENLTLTGFQHNGILATSCNNVVNKVRVKNTVMDFFNNDGILIEGSYNICIDCEAQNNGADGIGVNGEYNYIIHCKVSNNNIHGIDVSGSKNLLFNNIITGRC